MAGSRKNSKGASKGQPNTTKEAKAALAIVKTLPADQQYEALMVHVTKHMATLSQLEKTQEICSETRLQLETEHSKASNSVSRLESLCRELEKMRKAAREENMSRIKSEEEKRRDVSSKLNASMSDISGLMTRNTQQNLELREENAAMAKRLGEVGSSYETEQETANVTLRQLELQTEISDKSISKVQLESGVQMEAFLREKQKLLTDMQGYQDEITAKALSELDLRKQLGKFADQYEAFQETIASNHGVMGQFRTQMNTLTKKIKKLEKESMQWQLKWKKCNQSIVDMVRERTKLVVSCSKLMKQNGQLQKLGITLVNQLAREEDPASAFALTASQTACLTAEIEENLETFVKIDDALFCEPKRKTSREVTPVKNAKGLTNGTAKEANVLTNGNAESETAKKDGEPVTGVKVDEDESVERFEVENEKSEEVVQLINTENTQSGLKVDESKLKTQCIEKVDKETLLSVEKNTDEKADKSAEKPVLITEL